MCVTVQQSVLEDLENRQVDVEDLAWAAFL